MHLCKKFFNKSLWFCSSYTNRIQMSRNKWFDCYFKSFATQFISHEIQFQFRSPLSSDSFSFAFENLSQFRILVRDNGRCSQRSREEARVIRRSVADWRIGTSVQWLLIVGDTAIIMVRSRVALAPRRFNYRLGRSRSLTLRYQMSQLMH